MLKLLLLLCHNVYRKAQNINEIRMMLSFIQKSTQTVSVYLFIETKTNFLRTEIDEIQSIYV